ncbi:MAG: hypothetical protein HYR64_00210 [Fimbriimonas ginsengisoli]|uniref:DUF4412 domain-containing protein n=1 Tax=Fimbriimonas ginsengisoli TaxID=1005039 RepID=A0A931LQB9_FIMGI|nr:hypothetical protein [Fimbriimonas ginsengisoli]
MLPLVVFVLAALPIQAKTQATAAPKPDRSGEPMLTRLFDDAGSLSTVHLRIFAESRSEANVPMNAGGSTELWFDRAKGYRLEVNSIWGGGPFYVSDGKQLLVDPMDDSEVVVIRPAKRAPYLSEPEFSVGKRRFSPVAYLLDGKPGMEALVSKETPIRERTWPGGEHSVEFTTKEAGTINLFWRDAGKRLLVTRAEWDNLPFWKRMHDQDPGDYEEPNQPLVRQTVEYVSVGRPLDGGLFRTLPPEGRKVKWEFGK